MNRPDASPAADLQRLLAEEPFVRSLAASLIADEADDVVQQAYLRAIEKRPAAVREPRSWLARIVRNLVADQRRSRRRHAVRPLDEATHPLLPSSAELAEGEERRRELVTAVDALPAQLRTVVLLRWFEGLPPRRIARDLGVPVSVVWNRLHAALVALRSRLDAQHGGDRRAWLLPLVPFATSPRALPWMEMSAPSPAVPALVMGAIVMTTKTKLAALAAIVVVAVLAWSVWPHADAVSPTIGATGSPRIEVANVDAPAAPSPPAIDPAEPPRALVPVGAPATTGSLVVNVRYENEPQLAVGHTVILRRDGDDFRVGSARSATDAEGKARFAALAPGPLRVHPIGRPDLVKKVDIEAGAKAECSLVLKGGLTLTGIVVDRGGVPIASAAIEVVDPSIGGHDVEQLAVSGLDGTFTIRECGRINLVGARAVGFAASPVQFRMNDPGTTEHVRIELHAAGGAVIGVVVGPDGVSLAEAVVRVGEGRTESVRHGPQGAPPLPAQVRTDGEGRFHAIGVPVGKQPVMVRAVGFAPWSGTCEVTAGGTTAVRIVLDPGVTCTGSSATTKVLLWPTSTCASATAATSCRCGRVPRRMARSRCVACRRPKSKCVRRRRSSAMRARGSTASRGARCVVN